MTVPTARQKLDPNAGGSVHEEAMRDAASSFPAALDPQDDPLLPSMAPFTAGQRRRDPEARMRIAAVGCLLLAGVLILALSATQAVFSRWVSSTVLQTRRTLESRMPPSARREVRPQLDTFFASLDGRRDRDELTGEFMQTAQRLLADGHISREEAEELSAWLTSVTNDEQP